MGKPLILVVDDDPDIRALLEHYLTAAGYEVVLAADASAAHKLAGERTPDLVIADINLPEVSGTDFVASLREERGRDLSVVYLTALEQDAHLAVRTVGYPLLGKPVDPGELLPMVAAQLRRAPLAVQS
jgi:DNA-binding response OmpR family regulator